MITNKIIRIHFYNAFQHFDNHNSRLFRWGTYDRTEMSRCHYSFVRTAGMKSLLLTERNVPSSSIFLFLFVFGLAFSNSSNSLSLGAITRKRFCFNCGFAPCPLLIRIKPPSGCFSVHIRHLRFFLYSFTVLSSTTDVVIAHVVVGRRSSNATYEHVNSQLVSDNETNGNRIRQRYGTYPELQSSSSLVFIIIVICFINCKNLMWIDFFPRCDVPNDPYHRIFALIAYIERSYFVLQQWQYRN